MYTALTIAGSDSSGGAGIQADIKTMTANRVYAMSAITALTAQNTTGVTDIMEVTPKFLAEQLDSIFTDIHPDAIKTGMVSSSELIETIAEKLTEYHAVQVAFAKNLNQKRIDKWDKFSENQFVSYNDKRVSAKEYLQVWCDHYSYDMEYHYYNESDDRTNQFMYDLCQWMGYSIIFEKYCIEWNGTRKIKGFIPKDMEDLIEQFYISLRDDFGKEQIVSNYNQIKNKFNELNHIQFIGNENYFLIERTKGISAEKSFKEHCIAIEKIYNDMKKKHSPQFLTNQPYLNKSFVLQYFRKMYQDMLSVIDTPFLFKKYMEHYSLICLDDITKMKSFLESEIRPIFESKSYFEIVIKKIELLNEVEICTAPNGKSYYRIFNVQNFIESIGFTPAFLAALLMGIADAGYEIKFSNVMIISKVV